MTHDYVRRSIFKIIMRTNWQVSGNEKTSNAYGR